MLYSDLVVEVLPDTPGCPDMTIERAVRDAAIEFFDETLVYTVDQDPVPVYAGLDIVDLEIPAQTRLVTVLRAQLGAMPLERVNKEDLFQMRRNWQTDIGRPIAITSESSTQIRLLPRADKDTEDQLYIRFAVAPTRLSTSIPDSIGEEYFRELVHGAKAIVMAIPNMPWSNPGLAVSYRTLFDKGMRDATLSQSQAGVAAQRRIRIRRVV